MALSRTVNSSTYVYSFLPPTYSAPVDWFRSQAVDANGLVDQRKYYDLLHLQSLQERVEDELIQIDPGLVGLERFDSTGMWSLDLFLDLVTRVVYAVKRLFCNRTILAWQARERLVAEVITEVRQLQEERGSNSQEQTPTSEPPVAVNLSQRTRRAVRSSQEQRTAPSSLAERASEAPAVPERSEAALNAEAIFRNFLVDGIDELIGPILFEMFFEGRITGQISVEQSNSFRFSLARQATGDITQFNAERPSNLPPPVWNWIKTLISVATKFIVPQDLQFTYETGGRMTFAQGSQIIMQTGIVPASIEGYLVSLTPSDIPGIIQVELSLPPLIASTAERLVPQMVRVVGPDPHSRSFFYQNRIVTFRSTLWAFENYRPTLNW